MPIKIQDEYLSSKDMLSKSGEDLLKSGMFSDVIVKCGDRVWKLHKIIICPRCPYFNMAFNGHFKEATTGEITLQDQVPDDIDQIIRYLYTGEVSQLVRSRPSDYFKLADFFQIRSLVREIISIIDLKLDGMATRLEESIRPGTDLEAVFTCEEIKYLFRAIETSYATDSSSYAPLRDLVKDFIVKSAYRITQYDRFLKTLESIPMLAVDIWKLLQDKSTSIVSNRSGCWKCGHKTNELVGNRHGPVLICRLQALCKGCKNSY
ncbi:POZ domain-containing protein [Daldinia vernicosa]|uniref:POZ domain-containing protein n=1 Tax=Daldinia vernicosa TaxID=114800 RepID=UPI00200756D4|nr:POZ domain-containing protein [Daldinia vernicosa]KAI0850395.1 POZ domain-containing protein [Daldinia vernicosa]